MSEPSPALFEVSCPCCEASLKVDPETHAVIDYKEKEKPRPIEDLNVAVAKLKGESARRDEVFRKNLAEQKTHQQVLEKKFDELFKKAKEGPIERPTKDIDLD